MTRPAILAAGLLAASALGAMLLLTSLDPHRALAQDEIVSANRIETFLGANAGDRVQGLVWHGGLQLQSSSDAFGGLSGIGFVDDVSRLVMVSDTGHFVSGQLIYDEQARPLSLVGVEIEPIRNSGGAPLPRPYARDAEALAVIFRNGGAAAVRVGFENLTRVADFELVGGRPRGPAREVNIPAWLTDTRTNRSIESVCIAPPASPIAGSTLLITEGVINEDGLHAAELLGVSDRGPLSYRAGPGSDPTDCAFLPDGDLLVLERGLALLSFTVRLKRVPAADVRPGATMEGRVLLEASGGAIDNMEGLAVHQRPDGSTGVTIVSDNNFNDWQRTLLLQFSLPD